MILNSAGLTLAIHGVYVAVEVRRVFLVNSSLSSFDLEFLLGVRGIEEAEFLAIGGNEEHIVTALGKKTDLLALGNAHVHDYNSARLNMADSLGEVVRFRIVDSEFLGNNRAEDIHIRAS